MADGRHTSIRARRALEGSYERAKHASQQEEVQALYRKLLALWPEGAEEWWDSPEVPDGVPFIVHINILKAKIEEVSNEQEEVVHQE